MQFYNHDRKLIVSAYKPSNQFSEWEHFAISCEETDGLEAIVGPLNKLDGTKVYCLEDYLDAAECIQQGQLYANAKALYEFVSKAIAQGNLPMELMLEGLQIQERIEKERAEQNKTFII